MHRQGESFLFTYASRREKTRLWGFRQSKTQTSLLSYSDLLENWNPSEASLDMILSKKGNNKDTDLSAQIRRLVCAFVVRKP